MSRRYIALGVLLTLALAIGCTNCSQESSTPNARKLDYWDASTDPLTARDIQLRNRQRVKDLGSIPYVED
jgi:hypothetical protein